PRIALVLKTLNSPFFINLKNGAEQAALKADVELIVQAPEREIDVEKQMQIIENLIQIQVNAICVSPSGSRELIPAIAKANKANIPVLIVDTRIDEKAAMAEGVKTVTFIGSDNYEGGKIAGEYLGKICNEITEVAILEGIPGHETGDNRLRGFTDGIKKFPNIKIVASQPANWERDQGYNVTQNILQAHNRIKAVFACNDLMALGAMEAVGAAGRDGKIKILGFDAVDEARKEIKNGKLEASVAQNPEEMGRLVIENAIKVIQGKSIPAYIPVKIELITISNIK
ncbi:MAG: sugar ABC transporter substrate-binding protein, partial [Calditrichia bacterium]|nr:sugar ABC transporter substrate-binding protein [Calditrichia bacterium]